jgi:predicted nuclease of predicted toxin-antitoxin system
LSLALYMDVHVPRAVTTALRLRGIDAVTAQEDGAAELDDGALLKRATELGRILVSQDEDLLCEGTRLQKEAVDFAGIIYAHQLRITIGQMVEDLELIANATTREEWHGKIEYLPIG